MKIKLSKEQKLEIEKPTQIHPFIKKILKQENKIGQSREHFWVVGLSMNLKILFIDLLSLGKFTPKSIIPREVFQEAIKHSAQKIILLRYEPYQMGNIRKKDKNLLNRVLKIGKILDIEIADYIVFCDSDLSSIACH